MQPFLDDQLHGLFATRDPYRPNPIGLSVVRLLAQHENILDIEGEWICWKAHHYSILNRTYLNLMYLPRSKLAGMPDGARNNDEQTSDLYPGASSLVIISASVFFSFQTKRWCMPCLFYSPNCGHCHLVITELLPPLVEQYGEQLSIVGVDVTQPDGQALFLAALQHFNLESGGVPFLVVGDTYLVGS